MLVAPASSKEVVTHHVLGTINWTFPIPSQMESRSSGPVVFKSVVIRAASGPAWVHPMVRLIPRTSDQGRILMRLVGGLVALQCLPRGETAIKYLTEPSESGIADEDRKTLNAMMAPVRHAHPSPRTHRTY